MTELEQLRAELELEWKLRHELERRLVANDEALERQLLPEDSKWLAGLGPELANLRWRSVDSDAAGFLTCRLCREMNLTARGPLIHRRDCLLVEIFRRLGPRDALLAIADDAHEFALRYDRWRQGLPEEGHRFLVRTGLSNDRPPAVPRSVYVRGVSDDNTDG